MEGGLRPSEVEDLPFTTVMDHVRACRRLRAVRDLRRFEEDLVVARGKPEAIRQVQRALSVEAGEVPAMATVDDLLPPEA